jgi:hypothetical protein
MGGNMSRPVGDENWARLERKVDEAATMIAVGEAGWERRFEEVVLGMMPLRGVGRRLVALALIGELDRRASDKGLKATKELFERADAMEREYERSEKLQGIWEKRGAERSQPDSRWTEMTPEEERAEDEKELEALRTDGGLFAGLSLRGYVDDDDDGDDGGARRLFEYAKSAVSLFGIISEI